MVENITLACIQFILVSYNEVLIVTNFRDTVVM